MAFTYVAPTPNTDPNNFGTVDVTLDPTMSLATIKTKISQAGEGGVVEWAGSTHYLLNGSLGGFLSGQKHFTDNGRIVKCTSTAGIDSFLNLKSGTGGVPSTNVTISDLEFWGHTNVPNATPSTAVRRVIVPWSNCFFRRVKMKGGANNGMLVSGDRVVTGMVFDTCEWSYNIHTPRAAGTCGGWKVNELGSWNDYGEIMKVLCGRAHHNQGHGGWFDIGSSGVLIAGWESDNNQQTGLFFEVSSSAYFRDNNIHDNTENGIWIESGYQGYVLNNTLGGNGGFGLLFHEDHDPQTRSGFSYPYLMHAGKNEGYEFPTYGNPANPAGGAGWLVQGNVLNGDTAKYRETYANTDPAGPSFTNDLTSDSRIHYSTTHYVDPGGGGGGGGGGGPITVAEQVETVDATNSQTYAAASFTPPANSLLVVHLAVVGAAGSTTGTVAPTATGYVFTPLTGMPVNVTNTDPYQVRAWWTTTGSSPGAMTISLGTYSANQASAIIEVLAFTGADLVAPSQVKIDTAGNVQPSVSLNAPPDAASTIVVVNQMRRNPPAWTAEAGWTQHTNIGSDGPNGLSIWSKTSDQSFTASGTNGQNWGFMYEVATTTAANVEVTILPAVETDAALPFSPEIPAGLASPYIIEFDQFTPLLDVPTAWTDVTAFVREFNTRRGRNHELGKMQAGEASLTLDNRDRRFDPTFTTSPYFPNIVPMRHARIRASRGGVIYPLFTGFVEDWGQQWSGPAAAGQGDATCEVHLVDAFSVLNRTELKPYPSRVLSDEPIGYWQLADPPGTTTLLNEGSEGTHLTPSDNPTFANAGVDTPLALGQDGPLPGGATAFHNDVGLAWISQAYEDPDTWADMKDFTIEAWVFAANGQDFTVSGVQIADQNNYQEGLAVIQGVVKYGVGLTSGAPEVLLTGGTLTDATWNHVAVVREGSLATIYINGAVSASGRVSVRPINDQLVIGNYSSTEATTALLAHVAWFDKALTAEDIAFHYASNIGQVGAQTVDAAIEAVLDAAGWPGSLRAITASVHTISQHVPNENLLSELIMLAEDTDGGAFFVRADGLLAFRSSSDLAADATAAAAWGDSDAELKYSDLKLRYDDEDLYTEVRATAAGLSDVSASDTAARDRFGPRTLEADAGVLGSQLQLNDRATGYLARYVVPKVRPETLSAVDSLSQPARIVEMFSSEIGRRVTVTRRPPGGGSLTLTAVIEGVSHSSVEQLTQIQTGLSLAPVDLTPWVLENATYGALGTTTRLGW